MIEDDEGATDRVMVREMKSWTDGEEKESGCVFCCFLSRFPSSLSAISCFFGCLLGKEMEEKLPLVIVRLRPCRCECDGVPSMFPPNLCMRLLEFPTNQKWLAVLVTTSPRQMPCHASLQGSG